MSRLHLVDMSGSCKIQVTVPSKFCPRREDYGSREYGTKFCPRIGRQFRARSGKQGIRDYGTESRLLPEKGEDLRRKSTGRSVRSTHLSPPLQLVASTVTTTALDGEGLGKRQARCNEEDVHRTTSRMLKTRNVHEQRRRATTVKKRREAAMDIPRCNDVPCGQCTRDLLAELKKTCEEESRRATPLRKRHQER